MANTTVLNTVYNHFLTTYAPTGTNTKYDTHKKSELRDVYNSIVRKNKDTPLFLLDSSDKTREYVVGLKEDARTLKNTISSLSMDNSSNLLDQKSVLSGDESIVSAEYIGSPDAEEDVPELEISVSQLAKGQINDGYYLNADEMNLPAGTYSFDIHSRDMDYEFQFNIGENDTNRLVEEKLARLITKSNIGVTAEVKEDETGRVALSIASDDTGVRGDADTLFIVSDDKTSKASGTVGYFGIGNVTQYPQNSEFELNGVTRSTFSNHFSIDKTFELTLNGISPEGETVNIGLKTDVESLSENVSDLIEGYNSFMNKIMAYTDSQPYSKKLYNEMSGIASLYSSDLSLSGISVDDSGMMSLNKNTFSQSVQDENYSEHFKTIQSFAENVLNKINQVSLDPMEYTDKRIVEYKNPGRSFTSPYVTSNYSGMMFNSYC